MRAIDADALHKRIKAKNTSNAMRRVMKAECLAEIDDAPTIEPERKTGRWIYKDDDDDRYDTYMCSECHHTITVDSHRVDDIGFVIEDMKYCNNCGTKMEGQPEIIHCRDCIAYQEGIDIDGKPFTRCNGSVRTYGHTLPDWYCADAERRTDEGD